MRPPTTLVLATANPHKADEIAALLPGVELLARPESVGDVAETAEDLLGNALLKAQAVAAATGMAAVADDTGLEVHSLGGRPGVHSARYAGPEQDARANVALLLSEMTGVSDRRARFRTVALVALPDGSHISAEGCVDGEIAVAPRGEGGFGYDPVFMPDGGGGRTFAQMSAAEKNSMSHRARAFAALAVILAEE